MCAACIALGIERADAVRLAIRCARDSMPPMRLAIIDYLADHPAQSTQEVRRGIDKPRSSVDRQLQALHHLGVLTVDESEYAPERVRWYYSLVDGINPKAIQPLKVVQNCE